MNCGDSVQPRPSVGAWVMYGLGTENRNLPGFIAMCPGGYPISDTANWQSGFLPGAYQGTFIDSKHREIDKLIENIRSRHASGDIQRRQLEMLRRMADLHRQRRVDGRPRGADSIVRAGVSYANRSGRGVRRLERTEIHPRSVRHRHSRSTDARRAAATRTRRALHSAVAWGESAVGLAQRHHRQYPASWPASWTGRSPRS